MAENRILIPTTQYLNVPGNWIVTIKCFISILSRSVLQKRVQLQSIGRVQGLLIIQVCLWGRIGEGGYCAVEFGILEAVCSAYCAGWYAVPTQHRNSFQIPTSPTQDHNIQCSHTAYHPPTSPHKHTWIISNPQLFPMPFNCAPFRGKQLLLFWKSYRNW